MYPRELTLPMEKDLTEFGFNALHTAEDVDTAINNEGTTLVVVNSVCGCAAGNARPGVKISVTGDKKPDQLVTVFAGVDREATDKARSFMIPYPPSSPCIALFKGGQLVHMLERHHIEGQAAEGIAENLYAAFESHC